jgi:hypothetical protein
MILLIIGRIFLERIGLKRLEIIAERSTFATNLSKNNITTNLTSMLNFYRDQTTMMVAQRQVELLGLSLIQTSTIALPARLVDIRIR